MGGGEEIKIIKTHCVYVPVLQDQGNYCALQMFTNKLKIMNGVNVYPTVGELNLSRWAE